MSVTVQKLTENNIPAEQRGPNVDAIWAVLVNDEVIKYCRTSAEAIAMYEYLEEQWREYLEEREGTTHYKAPRPR